MPNSSNPIPGYGSSESEGADSLCALVDFTRMGSPACVRIGIQLDKKLMAVDVGLADFALCLTGRGATPALVFDQATGKQTGAKAEVGISRMSNPECVRIRVEIDRHVIDLDMALEGFTLCLTGQGATGAVVRRNFIRHLR